MSYSIGGSKSEVLPTLQAYTSTRRQESLEPGMSLRVYHRDNGSLRISSLFLNLSSTSHSRTSQIFKFLLSPWSGVGGGGGEEAAIRFYRLCKSKPFILSSNTFYVFSTAPYSTPGEYLLSLPISYALVRVGWHASSHSHQTLRLQTLTVC